MQQGSEFERPYASLKILLVGLNAIPTTKAAIKTMTNLLGKTISAADACAVAAGTCGSTRNNAPDTAQSTIPVTRPHRMLVRITFDPMSLCPRKDATAAEKVRPMTTTKPKEQKTSSHWTAVRTRGRNHDSERNMKKKSIPSADEIRYVNRFFISVRPPYNLLWRSSSASI